MSFPIQLLVFVVLPCALLLFSRRQRGRRAPLPPGPPRLPLIGNLLDIPAKEPWLAFTEMRAKYGDVTSLTMPGRTIILVHTASAATSILIHSSALTSERPVLPLAGALCGYDTQLPLSQYTADGPCAPGAVNNRVKAERKCFHGFLGTPGAVDALVPRVVDEVRDFLRAVEGTEGDVMHHISRATMRFSLRIAYGHKADTGTAPDAFVREVEIGSDNFFEMTKPGASFVDLFPILRHWPSWLPGGDFHRVGAQIRKHLEYTRDMGITLVKQRMAHESNERSLASSMIETKEDEFLTTVAAFALGTGASDTTASQLSGFFLAMALNPDIQRAAQAELDAVVGRSRLPTLEDQSSLPYVDAVCKEVLRWFVSAPAGWSVPSLFATGLKQAPGLPHRAKQDFVYESATGPMLIPKDAMLVPNIWQLALVFLNMNRDPDRYVNPDKFDPTRFIATKDKPAEENPAKTSFGFGRRICPGRLLAESSLFLFCSAVLSVFDIGKAHDSEGKEIDIALGFTTQTVM
ncbi:unnamed protein product [Mycena citricolor]|uniref:Cytochrome P450 n=1 Tax=Mycena citricolor TaxID=2018698 RepID=A0AAD2K5X8_9AGAR|nr:unnamed protein product [Mycena citricolor]